MVRSERPCLLTSSLHVVSWLLPLSFSSSISSDPGPGRWCIRNVHVVIIVPLLLTSTSLSSSLDVSVSATSTSSLSSRRCVLLLLLLPPLTEQEVLLPAPLLNEPRKLALLNHPLREFWCSKLNYYSIKKPTRQAEQWSWWPRQWCDDVRVQAGANNNVDGAVRLEDGKSVSNS